MAATVLSTQGAVTLSAAGYGVVTLAPESFRTWTVSTINVRTTQSPTQTPVPQCTVYEGAVGGPIVAQTYMGNRSTAVGERVVQPSQPLVIEWTGGVPGSVATAYVYGTQDMR